MCVEKFGVSGNSSASTASRALQGGVRLRGKESPAQREQERQHRESASTKRDAGLGVEATLKKNGAPRTT